MFEVQPVAIDSLEELKLPTRKKLSSPCSRCLPLSSPPCLDDTLHLCLDLLVHIPPMFCMLQPLSAGYVCAELPFLWLWRNRKTRWLDKHRDVIACFVQVRLGTWRRFTWKLMLVTNHAGLYIAILATEVCGLIKSMLNGLYCATVSSSSHFLPSHQITSLY